MPGVFGFLGRDPGVRAALRGRVERAWPAVEWLDRDDVLLGAHAHGPRSALRRFDDGSARAVDGDRGAYVWLATSGPGATREEIAGVVVDLAARSPIVTVRADVAGAFPFFHAAAANGVVFGSLQHVVGGVTGAPPDLVGCAEVLRFGATTGGRSCLEGVTRLQAGQEVRVIPGRAVEVRERSTLWTGSAADLDVREVWERLRAAGERCVGTDAATGLMMSAGWDSRTLLAMMRGAGGLMRLTCYSHGDLASRELRLARSITRGLGLPHVLERIDEAVYDASALDEAFLRTENLIFPHWYRAGRILAALGIGVVASGVFGEVFGGHYGPLMVQSSGRGRALLRTLGWGAGAPRLSAAEAEALLRIPAGGRPWYLARDVLPGPSYADALNEDASRALARLRERGIADGGRLVEAYLTETRGAQYIHGQNLALRASVDTATPFADPEVLQHASAIPLGAKVHNRLNRLVLRSTAPDLLRYPLAATLVSAGRPLLVQELSRVARKGWEVWARRRYLAGARAAPARLGWVDFRFLARSDALRRLVESLRAPLWDREALEARVASVERDERNEPLHPMFDQLNKILTVDRIVAR